MDSDELWRAQDPDSKIMKKEYWEAMKDPTGGIVAKITSDEAIKYSANKYGYQKDGTMQNALQHALWNAMMTYKIGEDRAKKFADAHEVLPGSLEQIESNNFSRKQNSEMDYYYNELGRKAALELIEEKKKQMPDGSFRVVISPEEMTEYVNKKIQENATNILLPDWSGE